MIVKYKNLINIKVSDNNEKLLIFQNDFLIRESVLKKLLIAQKQLEIVNQNLTLSLKCGYRSMETQIKMFIEQVNIFSQQYFENPIDLYERVHQFIAVPSVSGHPTGGAIDITIVNKKNKKEIDFGSRYLDFKNPNISVFSKNVSKTAKKNRMLLRSLMVKNGFAPFDGEWWHFSYGDKEWAFYYQKKFAIYNQLLNVKIQL
jgi:D-alanyl-D-alanine dipeptidase